MKGLRLLKQNNKGVGIISVIIALSFLATLGLLIMAISYTSSEMKSSERTGREVAYNASGVVEQLRSGVELAVSDSIKDCYTGVMTNYSFHRSDIENTFDREFSEALCSWKPYYVDKSGSVYYYISNDDPEQKSIDKSLGIEFLCGTPEIRNVGTSNQYSEYPNFNVNALKKFVKARFDVVDDDIIITCLDEDGNTADDGLGVAEWKTIKSTDPTDGTETYTPVSITLKDIQIAYRKIFRTVRISTDIVIDFPDTGFVYQEETHGNKYTEFAIIAKDGFELGTPGGYVKIDGKAYAGNVVVSPKTPSHMLWVGLGSMLVTPGNVEIYGKNTSPNNPTATDPDWPSDSSAFYTNNKAELWANGIKVNYDSVVNLRGNTYVKNDLNLAQPKAKATLAGNYFGFGGDDTNPDKSSSIIAQGYSKTNNQTELNLSEITTLSLGGYSFVNVVNENGTPIDDGKGRVKMGQSMAVTEDQTVYLIPVDLMQNESKGISLHTNPEVFNTADDYDAFIRKFQKTNDDNQPIDEYYLPAGDGSVILKNVPDGQTEYGQNKYVDRTAAYYGITVQPVSKSSGTYTIGYFFMKFASPNQANQFFRDYFATHTDRVTNYTKQYIKLKDLDGNDIEDVVGNFQMKDIVKLNSTETVGYDNSFANLCVTLYTDKKAEAAPEPERRSATNPFDYYSRHDNAGSSYLDKAMPSPNTDIYYVNNSGERVALITNENYEFTGTGQDSSLCLIISTADVTVKADFNGLIMCKGKVVVQGNAVLKPDTDSVDKALRESTKQGGGKISIIVKDSNNIDQTVLIENPRDYLYYTATESSEEFEAKEPVYWDVGSLVHFDKWKKG